MTKIQEEMIKNKKIALRYNEWTNCSGFPEPSTQPSASLEDRTKLSWVFNHVTTHDIAQFPLSRTPGLGCLKGG